MSPVAQSDRALNNETCKSLKQQVSSGLLNQRSQVRVLSGDFKKVFDLILTTAVNGHMKKEDMPKNVLIISDMEFDSCATCGGGWSINRPNARLFDVIKKRFENAGYQIPRLVFWNVNSRTGTIPVKENDLGVALVSGFSTNVCKMVMSGKTDPYECLVETLMSDRYDAVEAALKNS